jgi:ribonuclease HI
MGYRKQPRTPNASGNLFTAQRVPRPPHHLVAHIDGGARGNPGPAGYGVVIEDQDGRRIADLSEFLGIQTNNHAEYRGLLAALQYAVGHDSKALQVVSDSELMVRQIKGIYNVKSPALAELHQQVRALIRKLRWFEIGHVLRGDNRDADRLANEAMDRGMARGRGENAKRVLREPT